MTPVTGSQSVRGIDMNCCGTAQHSCNPWYSADSASFHFGIPNICIVSFLTISTVMCNILSLFGINPKGFKWINKESSQNQIRSYWINFPFFLLIQFDSSMILLGFFRFQWKSCASGPRLCLECNTSSLYLL